MSWQSHKVSKLTQIWSLTQFLTLVFDLTSMCQFIMTASKLSLIHQLSAEASSALHLWISANLSLLLSWDLHNKRSQWFEWVIQCWRWTCQSSTDKKTFAIAFQTKYQSQKIRKQFYDLRLEETSIELSVCNKFNDDNCIYSSCIY